MALTKVTVPDPDIGFYHITLLVLLHSNYYVTHFQPIKWTPTIKPSNQLTQKPHKCQNLNLGYAKAAAIYEKESGWDSYSTYITTENEVTALP